MTPHELQARGVEILTSRGWPDWIASERMAQIAIYAFACSAVELGEHLIPTLAGAREVRYGGLAVSDADIYQAAVQIAGALVVIP